MAARTSSRDLTKAALVGIGTAVILSAIMVPLFKAGLSPLPKPLGLAFAQKLLGPVPLPVGLLFHLLYVTAWSVIFVVLFQQLSLRNAFLLALGLWGLVLILFFPLVGWGLLGLGIGPQLILASLLSHVLFAFVLWALCRWAFAR